MRLLAEDLVARVSEIITRYSMLASGHRVGVAVSGGVDSVSLLHVLHRLVSEFAIYFIVLHVNHGLRGVESDADEQFVRELASELGCEFLATRAEPGSGNLEQAARDARRAFFQKCRREHGLNKIALGHNRGDQVETVLYRFLRGSGIAGLAGMRPVTDDALIRPFLFTSRSAIRAWASAHEIKWREDCSNIDEAFARNRLRRNTIPALTADFNPNLEATLAGTADVASAEEDYWQKAIEPVFLQLARRNELGLVLKVPELWAQHRAVQRRLIRHAVCQLRGNLRSIDLKHIDAILDLSQTGQGHDRVVVPGVDAIRSFQTLLLTEPGQLSAQPRQYRLELPFDEVVELPYHCGRIQLALTPLNQQNCVNFKEDSQYPNEVADLDFEALTKRDSSVCLEVRNWRPGDEMIRPGHTKPEKIKSLFQEFQVLLWQRRHWPVAVVNNEVFWARGFGVAAPYLAVPESDRMARLSFWKVGEG